MTVSKIVVKPDPDMVYKAVLDGQSYDIRIRYNQRLTNVSSGNPISADAFEIWVGLSGKDPILQTPLKTNMYSSDFQLPVCLTFVPHPSVGCIPG